MPQRQTVARNTIYLAFEPIVFGVVSIIVAGYVARSIGAAEYGKLAFVLAVINFFTLFTNLGFNNYLMNEFSTKAKTAEKEFIPIVITRFFLSLITYLLGALFINVMGYPPETKIIYYAAGLTVFPLYAQDSCEGVFKGKEKMQYIALLKTSYSLLFHLSRCLVVYMGFKALALAWVRVGVGAVTMVFGAYFVYKYFLKFYITFEWKVYKKVILGTLPFAFSTSFLIIYNRLDVIMLSYFSGDESVAYYKTAHLFIEKLSIVTAAVVGAVYPAVSRLYENDRAKAVHLYSRTFHYLFMLSIPIAVGGIMLSREIILLVFGTQYLDAVPVAVLLFSSIPVLYATSIMGNVLMAINEAKVFSYIMTALCLTNILTNLILIPYFAHIGAAAATLFAQVVNLIVLMIVVRNRFGAFAYDLRFVKVLMAAAIMGLAVKFIGNQNLFLIVLLGAVTYLAALIALKTIDRDELSELKGLIVKKS